MNKQKKLVLVVIILAVLLLGIGYAALSNVTLTINGNTTVSASQDNFKVYFTATNTKKSTESNVTATVTANSTSATVNFTGLSKKDDEEYVILEIENAKTSVDASSVNVTATATTNSIVETTATMCDASGNAITDYAVSAGSKTYVKVSAKVLKTPTEDCTTTISVTITAVPQDTTI